MPAMDFEAIEKLKREYTDKYVVADTTRPELARFRGQTGLVKTVNMSGRALVEFDGFANIGWYDIALECLKIVDKPAAKPAEAKETKAAAPAAKPAAAATAAAKPAAAAAAAGAKKSTADILAAARAKTAAAPAAKVEAPPAAAKPVAAPAGEAKKLSTAEILAAAREAAGRERSGGRCIESDGARSAEAVCPGSQTRGASARRVRRRKEKVVDRRNSRSRAWRRRASGGSSRRAACACCCDGDGGSGAHG